MQSPTEHKQIITKHVLRLLKNLRDQNREAILNP
jgi:hypothetical protein